MEASHALNEFAAETPIVNTQDTSENARQSEKACRPLMKGNMNAYLLFTY